MNAAALNSMERIGIMTWEEDDNIAICHHCGLIRPEDDHCQCVKARLAREDARIERMNKIMNFLFALWIISSFCKFDCSTNRYYEYNYKKNRLILK